jgi:hypothetical protein
MQSFGRAFLFFVFVAAQHHHNQTIFFQTQPYHYCYTSASVHSKHPFIFDSGSYYWTSNKSITDILVILVIQIIDSFSILSVIQSATNPLLIY